MTERPGVSHGSPATLKHSRPFFISTKLFRNKRLKAKRLRWLQKRLIINATGLVYRQNTFLQQQLKKTDPRFNKPTTRTIPPPSITIDLLSDDDESQDNCLYANRPPTKVQLPESKTKRNNLWKDSRTNGGIVNNNIPNEDPLQQQGVHQSLLPQLVMFPSSVQLSQIPNISLIPVQPASLEQLVSLQKAKLEHKNNNNNNNFNNSNSRRQRKPQQPKRHRVPILVNTESIVLSDDEDDDSREPEEPVACSTPTNLMPPITDLPRPLHINIDAERHTHACSSNAFAQRGNPVSEEVTVSLVPRSSTAGSSCSSRAATCTNGEAAFPMLPDETTVHTVIANRTYELPLAKLREGLAISGAAEFIDNTKQKTTLLINSYRKNAKINTPPALVSPSAQQPVSLKLSSDLSISLISDDEDDPVQQHLNAEKLLRQQPHLSVRPIVNASASCSASNNHHDTQKRRKLG